MLLVGLTGFFFSNFTAQLVSSNFGVDAGVADTVTDDAWSSAVYTVASFIGILVTRPLERRLGLRRTFIGTAALLASFGALQPPTFRSHTGGYAGL